MPEIIATDLVVSEGDVRTYVETGDNTIVAALFIGKFDGLIGEVYYEPSIFNHGEIHLGSPVIGNGTLIHFNSGMFWDDAIVENYGLFSAVQPTAYNVRVLFAPSWGPDLYNAGTILAEARFQAIGYQTWDATVVVTNAETGIIRVKSSEGPLALHLANTGTVINHGQIVAHAVAGGREFAADTALAIKAGAGGGDVFRVTITNSGLIEATDENAATSRSTAIRLSGNALGTITNSGTIRGDYAIRELSEYHYWESTGITLENSGLIEGRVFLDTGYDVIKNGGQIVGQVDLGVGDDHYDGALGTVTGAVNGGEGNDRLQGGAGAEQFFGGNGEDILDGGGGGDDLDGGAGADRFVYLSAADSTASAQDRIRGFQSGVDQIDLSALVPDQVSWVQQTDAADNLLYNLVTIVSSAGTMTIRVDGALAMSDFILAVVIEPGLQIFGTSGDDMLDGGGGGDFIDAASGADLMVGHGGNDIYVVDHARDVVIEAANEGTDTVYALASYALTNGSHVETLSVTDHNLTTAIDLFGNEFAQNVFGNAGANILDGGGGADSMVGFGGNDIFVVDNAADVAFEFVGQGVDTVYVTTSYMLNGGSEIETLSARDNSSTKLINLTGNEFAQNIYGNAGINILDGLAGADAMIGFGGNDIFIVDNAADIAFEFANQGSDTVYTSTSYMLNGGSEIETLSAQDNGSTNTINLTGNEYANTLYGNAGVNLLDGLGGADAMIGFGGNDIFIVDNAGDVAFEFAGQGSDTVYALTSYALTGGSEVETLSVTDIAATNAISLTGNEYGNGILGNEGANLIDGKGGFDWLYGFGGADSFAFTSLLGAGNIDVITDFSAADDTILLDDAVFTGLGLGALGANAFAVGSAAGDADDRIIYNQATGQLLFDADGNGSGAAVQFAQLLGAPILTASDFTVI